MRYKNAFPATTTEEETTMLDVGNTLAVQSYSLRGVKESAKVIEQVKALGLERIVICGAHCDFNNPARQADATCPEVRDVAPWGASRFVRRMGSS